MSELSKLIQRARYCKNTGEKFIWDNSWLNQCEAELTKYNEVLVRTKADLEKYDSGDPAYPWSLIRLDLIELRELLDIK